MDDTLLDRTAGRHEAADDAGDHSATPRDRTEQTAGSTARIQGPCILCHEPTGFIVIYASKPEFLCAPCGRAIREAA